MDLKKLKELAGITERDHSGVNAPAAAPVRQQQLTELARMRQIAGLPVLVESYDDDEGMSRSERELAKMADRDLQKKGIKVNADPEKDLERLAKSKSAKKAAAKDDEDASTEERAASESKAQAKQAEAKDAAERKAADKEIDSGDDEPKAEKPQAADNVKKAEVAKDVAAVAVAVEKKKKNPDARAALRKWASENPNHTAKDLIAHGATHGMSVHNVRSFRHTEGKNKKKMAEAWVLVHPSYPGFTLTENKAMGQYQWIDAYSPFDAELFESKAAAEKVALYMLDWKNQICIPEKVE